MNRGKGSILERSKGNSKKSTNGERYSPQDIDTKSLLKDRRKAAGNCTSVIHTECLATPVKKCQLKTVEKCSAVPRIQSARILQM